MGDFFDPYGQLDEWSEAVERFGEGARQQLKPSPGANLGSTFTVPQGSTGGFSRSVAEMKVGRAVPIDVVLLPPPSILGDPDSQRFSVGESFVRVAWGSPSGVQAEVELDYNKGWRLPLVASYCRVEIVVRAIVALANPRAFRLGAFIAPQSGGARPQLTRTVYYTDVGIGGTQTRRIPPYAHTARFYCNQQAGLVTVYQLRQLVGIGAATLSTVESNGNVSQAPSWGPKIGHPWPVDPAAAAVQVANTGGANNLVTPRVTYNLAL